MDFSNLSARTSEATDLAREETKRAMSPASFFCSQAWALVLASGYFTTQRLAQGARGGVARKHRHRIQLALFGQLMASLEYMFKDFVAQVINLIPSYDAPIRQAKWISPDAERILSMRGAATTPGALLLHSTLGWHEPETVNARYKAIFAHEPIEAVELDDLRRLWILRHSVAHNAGYVTAYDAVRAELQHLSDEVVDIDETFVGEAYGFLVPIARRVAEGVGARVVTSWLSSRVTPNYQRDKDMYKQLKWLATCVETRTQDLPQVAAAQYATDYGLAHPPPRT